MSRHNPFTVGFTLQRDHHFRGPLRVSRDNALVVSDGHSRWYEQGSRGQIFSVFGTSPGTHDSMLSVLNPLGSGVNLEILQGWIAWTASVVAVTPTVTGWRGSNPGNLITTSESGVTKGACLSTTAVSRIKAWANTGLSGGPTGAFVRPFASIMTNKVMVAGTDQKIAVDNVDGAIVVPPGGLVSMVNFGAPSGSTAQAGILYAEVPLP